LSIGNIGCHRWYFRRSSHSRALHSPFLHDTQAQLLASVNESAPPDIIIAAANIVHFSSAFSLRIIFCLRASSVSRLFSTLLHADLRRQPMSAFSAYLRENALQNDFPAYLFIRSGGLFFGRSLFLASADVTH
jgi:hypothetical protein